MLYGAALVRDRLARVLERPAKWRNASEIPPFECCPGWLEWHRYVLQVVRAYGREALDALDVAVRSTRSDEPGGRPPCSGKEIEALAERVLRLSAVAVALDALAQLADRIWRFEFILSLGESTEPCLAWVRAVKVLQTFVWRQLQFVASPGAALPDDRPYPDVGSGAWGDDDVDVALGLLPRLLRQLLWDVADAERKLLRRLRRVDEAAEAWRKAGAWMDVILAAAAVAGGMRGRRGSSGRTVGGAVTTLRPRRRAIGPRPSRAGGPKPRRRAGGGGPGRPPDAAKLSERSEVGGTEEGAGRRKRSPISTSLPTGPRGGSYADLKKAYKGQGQDVHIHHMPADAASDLSRSNGPAIAMRAADHKNTASFDNLPGAREYRAAQADLISKGRFREAIEMDIADIRAKFGSKYDDGIAEMVDYAKQTGRW